MGMCCAEKDTLVYWKRTGGRAFLFGLFYGYIFIKSGSLLPLLIIHWLSNIFQSPLAAYYQTPPPVVNTLGGIFGYVLAALLLIL